ncbi:MAG: HAD-IIB family hydrolase [Gammaproteobacteria bacterium]|nr:HAD-IIB family hydrolase [Gammaproteobacteria bacterium]
MSYTRLLLCTDLDRTLLPNGPQPESPLARERFARLASHDGIILAYVTGRHLGLVEQAIYTYKLPTPRFAITDVGTRIHIREQTRWRNWDAWTEEIAVDWNGQNHASLRQLFDDLKPLRLQETPKQSQYKLSYYLPVQTDHRKLQLEMQQRLQQHEICASLVWSVDEPAGIGLLDVLPRRATKLHAVEFLRRQLGFTHQQTLFAGDSGNDLEVLASPIPAVLVANATEEVKAEALRCAAIANHAATLYLARGGLHGMNGNYSAGILEGVAHYHPTLKSWAE